MNSDNNNSNTPRLRFPGFTGKWAEKKFEYCFEFLRNNTLSRSQLNYRSGKAMNIHYGDILVNYGAILDIEKEQVPYITDDAIAEQACREILKNGDIIMADTAEDEAVGKCTEIINISDTPVVSGLHTIPLRPSLNFATGYLGYYLNTLSYRANLYPLMQGVKVTSISRSAIQGTHVHFPPNLAEQEKIAGCLSTVDALIAAQGQEVDALKECKQGLMQQLFPESGETTPRLRFPGFTGKWVEKRLGEVANKINRRNRHLEVSRLLTNSASAGVVDQSDYFERDIAVKDNTANYHIVEFGDFVYNPRISAAAPVGPISINKVGRGIMSPLYTIFRFHTGCIPFFEQYFQTTIWHSYLKKIANFGARFDRMNITSEGFFSMPLMVPSFAEQEKIAACLSEMDTLIDAELARMETLKAHKRSLMQQLFPQPSK